jgi:hypothetical protein
MAFGYGGRADTAAAWEPSVKYLLVLLLVEIFIVGCLRGLTNHGG